MKGIIFTPQLGVCQHETCQSENKIAEGFFIVKHKNRAETTGSNYRHYCKKCIVKFPQLMLWSRAALQNATRQYKLKAKFMRRREGKFPTNHYKINSSESLLKMLKQYQHRGYKVPVFGTNNQQVAVRENSTKLEQFDDTDITVKIHFWKNSKTGDRGFELKSL